MIRILVESDKGRIELEAELFEKSAADRIKEELPITSTLRTWGDEIYFDTGIDEVPADDATLEVDPGDVAFWPEGKSLCVFFGPTPASRGDRPVPASEVVLVGKTRNDPSVLRLARSGAKVTVEQG
ncbi:MAG: hypothetical protein GF409_01010 [Candidatus Omnitrophica bacterium]|nr:hypothetical protein [Candidatus Omnitrophota bacterium]